MKTVFTTEKNGSDVEIKSDVVSEILQDANLRGLLSACLAQNLGFSMIVDGLYVAHVQYASEADDLTVWFEIVTFRFPAVPRNEEQAILSFWEQVGCNDPKEIKSVNLTQDEIGLLFE
jgi:hypothetical protein